MGLSRFGSGPPSLLRVRAGVWVATLAAALVAPAAASAATFAVTNTNDAGEGSLRAAITQANARDGADTIDASGVSGTIELWSALPELTDPVELVGPGPERLTVRMWLFPHATYAAIFAMLAVLVAMAFTEDLASQLYASLLCFAVVVIAYFGLRARTASAQSPGGPALAESAPPRD